jgi:hypothetical protein
MQVFFNVVIRNYQPLHLTVIIKTKQQVGLQQVLDFLVGKKVFGFRVFSLRRA